MSNYARLKAKDYEDFTTIRSKILVNVVNKLSDLVDHSWNEKTLWKWFVLNMDRLETLRGQSKFSLCRRSTKKESDDDPHIGCPAWPNCDLNPNGCSLKMGEDVEWYGHRD